MEISLSKGGDVSLSEEDPTLNNLLIGFGWDCRATEGDDVELDPFAFILDASAFMLDATDKVRCDSDFIFYNQPKSDCGSVVLTGDNCTGSGDGDAQTVEIALGKVPSDVAKIAFSVHIHDGEARKQNFGMVRNAYIRCVNKDSGKEITRYDFTESASVDITIIFGEIYRFNAVGWGFRAVGQGFKSGLAPLAKYFGISV